MALKRLVKTALVGKPKATARLIRVGLMRGRRFNIDTRYRAMRLLGLEETEITRAVRDLSRTAVSAIDVGSNDGWYALYLASRPGIKRVLAFEPDPDWKQVTYDNFSLNDPSCLRKLTWVPKFVGDRDENHTWCRLDSWATQLPQPVFVKIDVDGGELDVLQGARSLLTNGKVSLVIETRCFVGS